MAPGSRACLVFYCKLWAAAVALSLLSVPPVCPSCLSVLPLDVSELGADSIRNPCKPRVLLWHQHRQMPPVPPRHSWLECGLWKSPASLRSSLCFLLPPSIHFQDLNVPWGKLMSFFQFSGHSWAGLEQLAGKAGPVWVIHFQGKGKG